MLELHSPPPFAYAHASNASVQRLLESCLQQLSPPQATQTIGIAYFSDSLTESLESLLQQLRHHYPELLWLGTVGMVICATGEEYYGENHAMALMLLEIEPSHFHPLPPPVDMNYPWSEPTLAWLQQHEQYFGFIHGDPMDRLTLRLIKSLTAVAGNGFINGGLSSSHQHHYQIFADEVRQGGISGVLFDEQVPLWTTHTQSCLPVGTSHRITRASGNLLLELDQIPAAEVLQSEVDFNQFSSASEIGEQVHAALLLPGDESGDYLVRNLLALDSERGIVAVAENMEAYQRMRFCRLDSESAKLDMEQRLQQLKQRIGGRQIRGGLYISCLGRGRNQFGVGVELALIQAQLGEFPLIGFFANGEIYRNQLYGYTGVLTLFG
ncbi:hypothetical protein D5085_13530 [Ectothiorhodospiraceae bacterium BW-2]|nr:hypothetical protein D5085_13530 [Ectothiorhodospiraceae bacterium BW-2]